MLTEPSCSATLHSQFSFRYVVTNRRMSRCEIMILDFIIPFCTFLLGCFFTYWLKRADRRIATIRSSVAELHRLSVAWFNQLHELSSDIHSAANDEQITALINKYESNRLILPDYLFHLEIIKNHIQCTDVTLTVEEFLRYVTNYRDYEAKCKKLSRSRISPVFRRPVLGCNAMDELIKTHGVDYLSPLDSRVQAVSIASASYLNSKYT